MASPCSHNQHDQIKTQLCDDKKAVKITWRNGSTQFYPYVWLRDFCRCEACFHPTALQRPTDFTDLDLEVCPENVVLTRSSEEGSSLKIIWPDGHISEYKASWLQKYDFSPSKRDPSVDIKLRYWGADVGEKQLRFFDFNDLMTSDKALYEWMVEIQELGLAVVQNAPQKTGQLQKIGGRVCYLRTTSYGPTFQVQSKTDPNNAAYTSHRLPLHTDLPYYQIAPGIQMLHCINQADLSGGENVFSDGFKAAEQLKKEDPNSFNILTSTVLDFTDTGKDYFGEFSKHARHPTIRLDDSGNIADIYWNHSARDPSLRIPETDVLPLYRAMKAFTDRLCLPSNTFKYRMKNGDILCFHNRRSLHAREAFTVTDTSVRHLEGGYLDWDEVNSRIRVLRQKIENNH